MPGMQRPVADLEGDHHAKLAAEGPSYGAAPVAEKKGDSHGLPTGNVSTGDAIMHLIRSQMGSGVLTLPFAFAQAGWAGGTVTLLFTISQGVFAMLLLGEIRKRLAPHGCHSIADVAQFCFGAWGRSAIEVSLFVIQAGVVCVYISMISENTVEIVQPWVGHDWHHRRLSVMALLLPMFIVLSLIRSVESLAPFSKFGNVAMVVTIVACTAYASQALYVAGAPAWAAARQPRTGYADMVMLAAAVLYSFEGLGLILPIANAMAKPEHLVPAIVVMAAVISVCSVGLAMSCGVAYRNDMETGSITAFLAEHAAGSVAGAVFSTLNLAVTLAIVASFSLQMLPAAEVLEAWLKKEHPTPEGLLPTWVLQRLCILAGCVTLACLVRDVALLVALFGAVATTSIAALPSGCHLVLMHRGEMPWSWPLALVDVVIVTFCAVIMVAGTSIAVGDIVAGGYVTGLA